VTFDYQRFKSSKEIREIPERNEKNVCLFISMYFRQCFSISVRVWQVCCRMYVIVYEYFIVISQCIIFIYCLVKTKRAECLRVHL